MRAPSILAFTALVLAAACSSGPVTDEEVSVVSGRLLAPYLSGREVGCDELVVEMTANFYPNVGRPSTDPRLHKVVRTRKDGKKLLVELEISDKAPAGMVRGELVVGLNHPLACPEVPSEVLDPRSAWKDAAAYDAAAKHLAGLFRENFAKFEAQASEAILVASPGA